MTVLGEVPTRDLGIVLPHEHLIIDRLAVTGDHSLVLSDERLAEVELRRFAKAGGGTLVELTVPAIGRDPAALRRLSAASGVHIVMGAGWYTAAYLGAEIDRVGVADLAARLVREFRDGLAGVYPGIIGEIGSDRFVSPVEERVLRAAGRAQLEVGCAISTHAYGAPVGLDQLDILAEEGVDPRHVIVGHCDSVFDPEYHAELALRGSWVQFDLLRALSEWDEMRRVELIAEFVDRGHAASLLLSHDVCAKPHLRAYGGRGYVGLFERYRGLLLAAGVGDDVFEAATTGNAQAALAGANPLPPPGASPAPPFREGDRP